MSLIPTLDMGIEDSIYTQLINIQHNSTNTQSLVPYQDIRQTYSKEMHHILKTARNSDTPKRKTIVLHLIPTGSWEEITENVGNLQKIAYSTRGHAIDQN